jgi:peptidylprolyl isomerase
MPIKKGDKVKVEYKGTLNDGTVFDSSEGREPLEFEVGAGQVIPGFDKAVVGMEKGDTKEISIKPTEAYGEANPDLVKKMPRSALPPDINPEPGTMLAMNSSDGRQIPVKVKEVTGEEITLDMNHPLAGETLNFEIKAV